MILVQYRPHSLIEHIGAGGPWDLNRDFTGGVRMYTPYKARGSSDWYLGTADAVQQNFRFIKQNNPDLILICSGDHIYKMNYDEMIDFHLGHKADLTIATIHVSQEEASRFGILGVDQDHRVTSFVEKPTQPTSTLINMGVYIFNLQALNETLWQDHLLTDSSHDFGKDILPRMVNEGNRLFAYPFSGYWVDVGTIESYWLAHMDLLKDPPPIDLNDRSWVIHTRTEEQPPVRIAQGTNILNSMITDGCVIAPGAIVERSILSPGVRVQAGAVIRESVILTDTVVGEHSTIERSIIDKHVRIDDHCHIGGIEPATEGGLPVIHITMVGKNSLVPAHAIIEPGAIIGTDVMPDDYPSLLVHGKNFIQTKRLPYEV
jgi:glucose-1-phosphate adenylyltransferase